MSDRYIRRFALPQRLYTDGAPVVLAAGVLLEDTRSPRLVAGRRMSCPKLSEDSHIGPTTS